MAGTAWPATTPRSSPACRGPGHRRTFPWAAPFACSPAAPAEVQARTAVQAHAVPACALDMAGAMDVGRDANRNTVSAS